MILAPILSRQEDGEDSFEEESPLSAEEEFMGNSLIEAIENKDIKGLLKVLRSIRR